MIHHDMIQGDTGDGSLFHDMIQGMIGDDI